jgi:hypothetical protein
MASLAASVRSEMFRSNSGSSSCNSALIS